MNILMALSQLEVTGAEVYATTIADELIRRGNQVFIVSDTLSTETEAEYIKLEFNKRNLRNRINHIKKLCKIIKENNIHIVHAHSRASSWSSQIACKLSGIPLITTTHGKQPVHFSRKLIKGFGEHTITVCENIKNHLIKDLGVNENNISVLMNPINFQEKEYKKNRNTKKIISIIGRLSGPKGEATFELLNILLKNNLVNNYEIRVIGGKNLPDNFLKFQEKGVNFLGYIYDVQEKMLESHLIIGAGRVAIEGILNSRPVIAVGENEYVGLVREKNLNYALSSNFGDISVEQEKFKIDENKFLEDIKNSLQLDLEVSSLKEKLIPKINLKNIVDSIEKKYFSMYVEKTKYEIPVVMYHRLINSSENEGIHGTYIYEDVFEKHMKYLKDNNYETLTFKDLDNLSWRNRFNGKKYIFLTFDDGYEDNYKLAFPILKKYNFKATIFLMAKSTYNEWDVKNSGEITFPLMSTNMIKEMQDYGIEFGAHTFNHPKINEISEEEIKTQITDSKNILEEKIGKEIITFAYPYGILNDYAKQVAKDAKYKSALATDSGPVCLSDDLYQIRRIAIFPNTNLFSFKRKIKGNYNFIKIKRENKSR